MASGQWGQREMAGQARQQLRTILRLAECVLEEFDGRVGPGGPGEDELIGRAERLREMREAVEGARERLTVLLRTCDEASRVDGAEAPQGDGTLDGELAGEREQETSEQAKVEALERRLEELKEEVRKKNRMVKGMIDLLRNMCNDFVMWDCCGKMSSAAK
ncbi:unnamed protein product [Ostreobium quekettii]|uniref:Mediator of RNA polymerase II transcription subunit 30 n=1 Tax=Ostreobium quekettii TaxID=121088 RepID=A0A8S1IKS1_9CHLO|nr:unnamed protein product [Ostreobium quekettii]|eukprot:evm.model.scf_1186.3 EVM.evm.TU.scf_1186.3   scf_1186:18682-19909(+)